MNIQQIEAISSGIRFLNFVQILASYGILKHMRFYMVSIKGQI